MAVVGGRARGVLRGVLDGSLDKAGWRRVSEEYMDIERVGGGEGEGRSGVGRVFHAS